MTAAVLILSGCGQNAVAAPSSAKNPEPVTITFMQRESTSTLKPYLIHLTNQFMKAHPGIKVELDFEPSESVLHAKEDIHDRLTQVTGIGS